MKVLMTAAYIAHDAAYIAHDAQSYVIARHASNALCDSALGHVFQHIP